MCREIRRRTQIGLLALEAKLISDGAGQRDRCGQPESQDRNRAGAVEVLQDGLDERRRWPSCWKQHEEERGELALPMPRVRRADTRPPARGSVPSVTQ